MRINYVMIIGYDLTPKQASMNEDLTANFMEFFSCRFPGNVRTKPAIKRAAASHEKKESKTN